MAEEVGVSIGHITKAVKVDELGRSEEVISGEKTVNEILREEGLLPPLKNQSPTDSNAYAQEISNLSLDDLGHLLNAIHEQLRVREKPLGKVSNKELEWMRTAVNNELEKRKEATEL